MAEDRPDVDAALRAGIALYNAGHYHPAHEPWEEAWLPLDPDADAPDEQVLHGLIQLTACIHHGRERNWSGAAGLAASAAGYLADAPDGHRGVDLGDVREYLRRVAADPATIDRVTPPPLRIDGSAPGPSDLEFEPMLLAAEALAGGLDGVDAAVVADATRYAREERGTGRTQYAGLLTEFLGDPDRRPLVYDRLRGHVERERARERDVDDLF